MKFETGKTYRTVGGHAMKIGNIPDGLLGKETDVFGNRTTASLLAIVYNLDGTPMGTGWSNYRLIPGAIEDEPKAEGKPPITVDDLLEQQGRMLIEIGRLKARVDNLNHRESAWADGIHRIGRLEKAEAILIKTDIEIGQRLAELRKDFNGHCATSHVYCHNSPTQPKPNGGAFDCLVSKPSERVTSPKRTIKGGWVNVYHSSFGTMILSAACAKKSDADAWSAGPGNPRLACIHIPDITEGEGL